MVWDACLSQFGDIKVLTSAAGLDQTTTGEVFISILHAVKQ
jgi:hypothetical protein